MSRVDDLRAELAAAQDEEDALAGLRAAKAAYRATGSPEDRAAARALATALRETRLAARSGRGRSSAITPDPVLATGALSEV